MKKLIRRFIFLISRFVLVNIAVAQEELLPDQVVTSINAPAQASTQQQIDVSWTVQNQGDGDAMPVWYNYLYLSTDAQLDASDTKIVL